MAVHEQSGRSPGAITPCLNRHAGAPANGAARHGHRLARRPGALTSILVAFAAVLLAWASPAPAAAAAPAMPRISVRGDRLYAGDRPWRAWGLNWGVNDHAPVIAYFDQPTTANFDVLRTELATARSMGANSMRIYLQLGQVMATQTRVRKQTLVALQRLLALAQRDGVYLDVTGDLVWRPARSPQWYAHLSWQARWRVQARFWKAVAHAAAGSPAVLCYELTSEPTVSPTSGYYYSRIGQWWFRQSIATATGTSADSLARSWTRLLAGAVRSQDNRPVTIGLLPDTVGPFAPSNIAGLLDMLVVHEYPTTGQAPAAISLIRSFADYRKPVLLGETFMLDDDLATQYAFLTGAARYLVGAFEFFDGRDARAIAPTTIYDAIYQQSLEQFISVRRLLLGG
jgi:hypothetical protein